MGHEAFLHGEGHQPDGRLEASTTAPTNKFPVPLTYKNGTGDIELSGEYTGDTDLSIDIHVIETASVSQATGIISDPSFSKGAGEPNSDALTLHNLGPVVNSGAYTLTCMEPSNAATVGFNELVSSFILEANGFREGKNNHYIDDANGGIDFDGANDNKIRMAVYDAESQLDSSIVTADVIANLNTGSGITYTRIVANSADFFEYSTTLYETGIDLPRTDSPEINEDGSYVGGSYSQAPLFLWGTPHSADDIGLSTEIAKYPIRGALYQQYKITSEASGLVKYKITNPDAETLPPGMHPYRATGSLIIHFYVNSDVDDDATRIGDLIYTHYLADPTDTASITPIRTWGELAKAINQHLTSHIYVHPNDAAQDRENFVVTNGRQKNPMVRLKFPEVNLPHSDDSINDWQNKPIAFTSYGAARRVVIEGSTDPFLSHYKVVEADKMRTEEVTIVPVTTTTDEGESQTAFNVYAPETVKFFSPPYNEGQPLALGLSYDQPLSTFFGEDPNLQYIGFNLTITNPNANITITSGGTPCDRKLKYTVVSLVGGSFTNPRSFHPVFDNVSGPESFPSYQLVWMKYIPPLCSSIPNQDDYDNCIYDIFSGATDTTTMYPYYKLDSGDAYRPNMNYESSVLNPYTNSLLRNNTHTFKHVLSSTYLGSKFRRSGEFLPSAGYIPGLSASVINGRLTSLDEYIEKFALSALDYEVTVADDGTYYVLMGAKEFTPTAAGSYIPSNEMDPFFEETCAGFFEPLAGSPSRLLADGKTYSWPVSSAFREPNMKVGNYVPRQALLTDDPARALLLKVSSLPVFSDDALYFGSVTNYSDLFPAQADLTGNVSDSHYNFTHHLFGLFASVYNFMDSMLDGTITDFGTGYSVGIIRSECLTLLHDLILYINDPRDYTQAFLSSRFTVDADFINQTYLYDQIAVQPRDALDELGMYNLDGSATTKELPLFDNAEQYGGMLDGTRYLGAMPYSTAFKAAMRELIYTKIGSSPVIADENIFVVCKPDSGFWGTMDHTSGGSALEHIVPYAHWGNFDNNRMMDVFMCRMAKAFVKTKWLIDLAQLDETLTATLKPNSQQFSLLSASAATTTSGITWSILEEDYWAVLVKSITQSSSTGSNEESGVEKNSRVYNGVTWVSSSRDVTYRIQFPCQAELSALRYGDTMDVFGTNSSYDEEGLDAQNIDDLKIKISNSAGDLKEWRGGTDAGGLSEWELLRPDSDIVQLDMTNQAGVQTIWDLAQTENLFNMEVTPIIPFLKGESFSWNVQGGEYVANFSDGTSSAGALTMSETPAVLKYGVSIAWEFTKGVPFYPGDWWRIDIKQPFKVDNVLDWNKENVWRTDDAAVTEAGILFDLGSDEALDSIALVGHNLTSVAVVDILAFDPADVVGDYNSKSVDDLIADWTAIPNSVAVSMPFPGQFAAIQGNAPYVLYPASTALSTTAFQAYLIRITDASLTYIEVAKFHLATAGTGMFEVTYCHNSEISVTDAFIGQNSVARAGDLHNADSTQFSVDWGEFILQDDYTSIRNLFTVSKRNNSEPFVWVPNMERDDTSLYVRFRGNFSSTVLDGFYRTSSIAEIRGLNMETV